MIQYGIYIFLFLLIAVVIMSQYKKCPLGHMIVIYKKSFKKNEKPLVKIAQDKAFVSIITQGSIMILEGPIVFGIDLLGAMSKNNEPINMQFIYTIEFSKNSEVVNAAIKNIANYNMKKLMEKIKSQISDTLYKEVVNFPVKEIGNDQFRRNTNVTINKKLNELGFELKDMKVKLVRNDEIK